MRSTRARTKPFSFTREFPQNRDKLDHLPLLPPRVSLLASARNHCRTVSGKENLTAACGEKDKLTESEPGKHRAFIPSFLPSFSFNNYRTPTTRHMSLVTGDPAETNSERARLPDRVVWHRLLNSKITTRPWGRAGTKCKPPLPPSVPLPPALACFLFLPSHPIYTCVIYAT